MKPMLIRGFIIVVRICFIDQRSDEGFGSFASAFCAISRYPTSN